MRWQGLWLISFTYSIWKPLHLQFLAEIGCWAAFCWLLMLQCTSQKYMKRETYCKPANPWNYNLTAKEQHRIHRRTDTHFSWQWSLFFTDNIWRALLGLKIEHSHSWFDEYLCDAENTEKTTLWTGVKDRSGKGSLNITATRTFLAEKETRQYYWVVQVLAKKNLNSLNSAVTQWWIYSIAALKWLLM